MPRGLARNRNRASTVRGRRLTAWATARPSITSFTTIYSIKQYTIYATETESLINLRATDTHFIGGRVGAGEERFPPQTRNQSPDLQPVASKASDWNVSVGRFKEGITLVIRITFIPVFGKLHTALQPKRTQSTSSPSGEPHISDCISLYFGFSLPNVDCPV
jgi:hypothetical protein